MSNNQDTANNRDMLLENFAAELTSAAYFVALRQGMAGSWINVELGLWKALAGGAGCLRRKGTGEEDQFEEELLCSSSDVRLVNELWCRTSD